MINMVEPREAADLGKVESRDPIQDGELTSLIRRWMAVGSQVQDRVRLESALPVKRERAEQDTAQQETAQQASAEQASVEQEPTGQASPVTEPVEQERVDTASIATELIGLASGATLRVAPERADTATAARESLYVVGSPRAAVAAPDDLIEGVPHDDAPSQEPQAPAAFPRLPQRTATAETEQVHRVAVFIDARRVSADAVTGLLQRLGERGSVNVCRAYADWSSADLGDWVGELRREGLHSFHHFAEDDDQALVAMTIDAVDIARDAAVDEVVIAGDLTSALPLVHRLHAAGVRVVAVGSAHTPHDVRAACHEFIDTSTIEGTRVAPVGRHRA